MKKLLTILMSAVLICGGMAYAQEQFGRIYGNVLDEEGAGLSGVVVSLESELIPTRTALTTEKGYFRFINLYPGEYKITLKLPGFVTEVREEIHVTVGGTVNFKIIMRQTTLEEEVTVIAESPIVDTKKTGVVTHMKDEILANIPSARDPWVILQQVPGMMMSQENVGGSESGQQSGYYARAGIGADDMWNVDGVTITDQAATGASPTYYDFDAFEEIQITTGGADPRIQSGGVSLNFVTKRGGNVFHGQAYFYRTGEKFGKFAMQAKNVPSDLEQRGYVGNRINQIKDFGFEVGGPLMKDRLWFWCAYGVQDIKIWTMTGASDDTLLENINAKLDFQVLPNNRLTIFYMRGDKNKWGRGGSIVRPTETTWDQKGPSPLYKFADEHVFSDTFLATIQYAFLDGGFQLDPKGGSAQPVFDYGSRVWRNSYYRYKTLRPQDQVNIDFNIYIEDLLGAGHELKFGVEYRNTPTYSSWRPDAMVVGGYYLGQPWDAWFLRGGIDDYYSRRYSAYIGDTITKGRLTLNLGLRYDWRKPGLNENNIPANPVIPNELPALEFAGLEAPFTWSNFSPRTGFTYDLTGDGKTLLRGSFNMYAGIMGNWMANPLNPLGSAEIDYYWNDANSDGLVTVDELVGYPDSPTWWIDVDPANPALVESNNTMASDLSAPRTWEAIIGFERELLPDFSVTIQGIYRKYTNFRWDNYPPGEIGQWVPWQTVTDPYTGQEFMTYTNTEPDPVGRHTENRTDDYYRDYKGGDIILNKRLSHKWMMNASFTLNFTKLKWDDSKYPFDPTNSWATNGRDYAPRMGEYFFPQGIGARWQFKLSGMYQLPYGFNISGFFNAREGYILPYFVRGGFRPGGWGWADALVDRIGEARYPTFWNLDMRIEKAFQMGDWGTLSFIADIFNVFNNNVSLIKDNLTISPTFNVSDEILGPRVFRAAARISF
jgi:hypothetical protein